MWFDSYRAMETVRRLERQDGAEDLKRARRLWLAGREDLSPEQVALVAALFRKRAKTARAFMIEEALREILSSRHLSREEAEAALDKWPARARRCRQEPFAELGRTVKKRKEGILAIFESGGMSNGPVEAVNGLIHAAPGRARGFSFSALPSGFACARLARRQLGGCESWRPLN